MKKLFVFLLLLLFSPKVLSAATLATDNFNRADQSNMTNWLNTADHWQVVSNTSTPTSFGSDALSVYDGSVSWPADQYSQAKLTVTSTLGGGRGPGVVVRAVTTGPSYYRAVLDHAASNNVEVGRMVSGTYTVLTNRTTTWVDGDVLRLEVTGTGASRVLKIFRNGTQLGADIADASGGIDAANRPGLGFSSSVTSASADDWEGGSMAAGGTVVPVLVSSQRRRRNQ